MPTRGEAISFYDRNYDLLRSWVVKPEQKITLGNKSNRVCRFCGRQSPEATFQKVAHAIPELLGNKSIGSGIEHDLGNWSKPMRTMARIRGKSGVPTLKRGGDTGWRIAFHDTGFAITAYEDNPFFKIDEANKTITFDAVPHDPLYQFRHSSSDLRP